MKKMDIGRFNNKYRSYGGFARLVEMRTMLFPLSAIAKQFRVSKECVRVWMKKFFGENYDPRQKRKEIAEKSKNISDIYIGK